MGYDVTRSRADRAVPIAPDSMAEARPIIKHLIDFGLGSQPLPLPDQLRYWPTSVESPVFRYHYLCDSYKQALGCFSHRFPYPDATTLTRSVPDWVSQGEGTSLPAPSPVPHSVTKLSDTRKISARTFSTPQPKVPLPLAAPLLPAKAMDKDSEPAVPLPVTALEAARQADGGGAKTQVISLETPAHREQNPGLPELPPQIIRRLSAPHTRAIKCTSSHIPSPLSTGTSRRATPTSTTSHTAGQTTQAQAIAPDKHRGSNPETKTLPQITGIFSLSLAKFARQRAPHIPSPLSIEASRQAIHTATGSDAAPPITSSALTSAPTLSIGLPSALPPRPPLPQSRSLHSIQAGMHPSLATRGVKTKDKSAKDQDSSMSRSGT